MSKIYLKKGREESLLRFHPWVFSGAIAQITGKPAEGDVVTVHASDGSFLAIGHYQIGSIAVRVLSFEHETLPADFWKERISKALGVRESSGLLSSDLSDCYRLIHGEGDGLPGLVVDYYNGVCVIQAHSVGMFRAKRQICTALREVYGGSLKAVYDKSAATAPFKAGLELIDGYLFKSDDYASDVEIVKEGGHRFYVNWSEGQKTGFFLDQRDSRALVEKYAAWRRVLNLFCYTGGFSVYALGGGAVHVTSVDSSARAMQMVDRNIALNGFSEERHKGICADAIDYLKTSPDSAYDLIIVDPPAFAKHRGALSNALRAYQRLNAAAISKVSHGGLVFTFSCSQAVDKEAFALAVFSAAAQTGRNVRILARLSQPVDHPVSIYHPEGEYLKGLLLYVE